MGADAFATVHRAAERLVKRNTALHRRDFLDALDDIERQFLTMAGEHQECRGLRRFLLHLPTCPADSLETGICDCGLRHLLRKVGA